MSPAVSAPVGPALKYDPKRLAVANRLLGVFAPWLELYEERGELRCSYNPSADDGHGRAHDVAARLRYGGLPWPSWRYANMGMGGTYATALAQVILYVRDEHRLPQGVFRTLGPAAVQATTHILAEADLRDGVPWGGAKTRCVVCGEPLGGSFDWWDGFGMRGACHHGGPQCLTDSGRGLMLELERRGHRQRPFELQPLTSPEGDMAAVYSLGWHGAGVFCAAVERMHANARRPQPAMVRHEYWRMCPVSRGSAYDGVATTVWRPCDPTTNGAVPVTALSVEAL